MTLGILKPVTGAVQVPQRPPAPAYLAARQASEPSTSCRPYREYGGCTWARMGPAVAFQAIPAAVRPDRRPCNSPADLPRAQRRSGRASPPGSGGSLATPMSRKCWTWRRRWQPAAPASPAARQSSSIRARGSLPPSIKRPPPALCLWQPTAAWPGLCAAASASPTSRPACCWQRAWRAGASSPQPGRPRRRPPLHPPGQRWRSGGRETQPWPPATSARAVGACSGTRGCRRTSWRWQPRLGCLGPPQRLWPQQPGRVTLPATQASCCVR